MNYQETRVWGLPSLVSQKVGLSKTMLWHLHVLQNWKSPGKLNYWDPLVYRVTKQSVAIIFPRVAFLLIGYFWVGLHFALCFFLFGWLSIVFNSQPLVSFKGESQRDKSRATKHGPCPRISVPSNS